MLFKPTGPAISELSKQPEYDPSWVNKLYHGCRRNISRDFRFICVTDWGNGKFDENVETYPIKSDIKDWWTLTEMFRPDIPLGDMNLVVGLDTVITGDLNGWFDYTGYAAMPRNLYRERTYHNGVNLYSKDACREIWRESLHPDIRKRSLLRVFCPRDGWKRVPSEMVLWRNVLGRRIDALNDLYPHQFCSYREEWAKKRWMRDFRQWGELDKSKVRLVYFHGKSKPRPGIDPEILRHWS